MTRALYYGSAVRNLKDVIQYFGYPLAKAAGLVMFKNNEYRANMFANIMGSIFYAGITSDWFGKEAKAFDNNCRMAVCAELGIDPEQFKFSDFYDSKNTVVTQERSDLMRINRTRYLTDAIFLVPMILSFTRGVLPTSWKEYLPPETSFLGLGSDKNKGEGFWSSLSHSVSKSRLSEWVYAGKSAYWGWETFYKHKTAHYEVIKLQEIFEPFYTDISRNDILRIYQSSLKDKGQDKLAGPALEALKPLLDEIVKLCNDDKQHAIANIVYLVGTGKINVLDEHDQVSAALLEQSKAEIAKVRDIGLKGIIAEKKVQNHGQVAHDPASGNVKRYVTDTLYEAYQKVRGHGPDFRARVSNRDPTEVLLGV